MKFVSGSGIAALLALSASLALPASPVAAPQAQAQAQAPPEVVPPIKDGGIYVSGWQGRIDAGQLAAPGVPSKLTDSKLSEESGNLMIVTGPAVTYWNPANTASGDYTVKATFNEPKFQNRMTHPHPYGVMIGGNDMGTDQNTYLYCAAYGNGTFIVRGFGPAPFQLGGRRAVANDAVHKAAGIGQPVTQDIAMSVKGDTVSCSINDVEVASYPKADIVGPGKLKSTDGIYGIRFAHNTEASVAGFGMSK